MANYVIHSSALIRYLEMDVSPQGHQLLAPSTIRSEVLQHLYESYRLGTKTAPEVKTLLSRLSKFKIRLLNDQVLRHKAFMVAVNLGCPDTYIAEYIALTHLHGDGLVVSNEAIAQSLEAFTKPIDVPIIEWNTLL